jgi:hypothetical protein
VAKLVDVESVLNQDDELEIGIGSALISQLEDLAQFCSWRDDVQNDLMKALEEQDLESLRSLVEDSLAYNLKDAQALSLIETAKKTFVELGALAISVDDDDIPNLTSHLNLDIHVSPIYHVPDGPPVPSTPAGHVYGPPAPPTPAGPEYGPPAPPTPAVYGPPPPPSLAGTSQINRIVDLKEVSSGYISNRDYTADMKRYQGRYTLAAMPDLRKKENFAKHTYFKKNADLKEIMFIFQRVSLDFCFFRIMVSIGANSSFSD